MLRIAAILGVAALVLIPLFGCRGRAKELKRVTVHVQAFQEWGDNGKWSHPGRVEWTDREVGVGESFCKALSWPEHDAFIVVAIPSRDRVVLRCTNQMQVASYPGRIHTYTPDTVTVGGEWKQFQNMTMVDVSSWCHVRVVAR